MMSASAAGRTTRRGVNLGSFDMRPVRLRSKTALRALVAVANPSDLAQRKPGGRTLAPIDVAAELQRARESLGGIAVTELAGQQRVTLDAILQHLRDDYDVLYLVCHGALVDQEPRLWLEDEHGATKITAGKDLVDGLARLVRLPRLVVLASCQSAGTGEETHSDDEGVLAALGPRLAEAGIPAVIAMQGNVLQRTSGRFMQVFFQELLGDGQIDRAMTEARFAVREHPDHWVPVLFTRLVTGRLWYESRLPSGQAAFQAWRGIVSQLKKRECIPVLGPGLLEPYVGSLRDLARQWGSDDDYPASFTSTCDIPQVAQFLSAVQGPDYPRDKFVERLAQEVRQRFPHLQDLPGAGSDDLLPAQRLLGLLSAARQHVLAQQPFEAHEVLARLDCPIYLTANPDNLLLDALRTAGKQPRDEMCSWQDRDGLGDESGGSSGGPAGPAPDKASKSAPLVYRMFGRLDDLSSLVLTEDDYFEYLIRISRLKCWPEPADLRGVLAKSSLMFLGFRVDDWSFRVFLQYLDNMPSRGLLGKKLHVGVQVDPDEGLGADPTRTRRFLEKYFHSSWTHFEIYWGSVEDFLQELDRQCQANP